MPPPHSGRKSNTQLQVTVGNVNLPLGQLFSSQPYHRLNVKSIHGASPAVVYEGVWETVVDVGCDLSTFSLVSADGNFTLMQHSDLLLHCYKELPTKWHWSGSPFFTSVFLSGAVGILVFVITSCFCHFKMKRSSLLKNQQKTADISKVTNTNIRAEVKSSLYLEPLPPPTIMPPKSCSTSATPVYENLEDLPNSIYDEIELHGYRPQVSGHSS
ncbi:uncharacterized protein LOC123516247 [Portunus trituberculatus]|uniref:uncharacterized protein LOC123516247 n=1 Tax=Portunus trituberculatus TaxID=210409 RepID=UPI001E1CF3BE|nr:uncharacterized protein LOC123516247 [Portunus trituberculatus]